MLNTAASTPFHILSSLRANQPHPAYRDKLMLFGQFIGVWDMDIKFFDDNGDTIFHGPGEWSFSWVLDGRVIQDVLTYADLRDTAKDAPGERRTGTTLRYYDPRLDVWRVIWLGAASGTLILLTGSPVGDEIWIEGVEDNGTLNRWMFTAITADSFHWKGMASTDKGITWKPEQEMLAHRRSESLNKTSLQQQSKKPELPFL